MGIYFIALAILFVGILVTIFVKEEWKMKSCAVSLFISMLLLLFPSLIVLFTGGVLGATIFIPPFFGDVNIVIDPLSAFFLFVISVISFIGSLFAIGYLKPYLHKNMNITSHCVFFMLLTASMLMVVTVQNALFFLFVWEIMSLSSFFLVIFENDKKENISSGIKYLIYMHISVLFLITAFALLNIKTNSFNFTDFAHFLRENQNFAQIIFLLSFIGFGIKAGFVPFHNWLPDAHPSAPSHISGIMSGVMIKTGIYGILRMIYLTDVNSAKTAFIVIAISIITSLWGILYAISKHDIKRLLAYSSIENIGIIGLGIGMGLLGISCNAPYVAAFAFAGAILHVLNHSVFKSLLFFAAGSIYKKTHTRDIELLGGLIKKMPYTSIFFIIGSVAISALPPFNGFISELLIYISMIMGLNIKLSSVFTASVISIASLALIGTMAVLCFSKDCGVMLLGNPRSSHAEDVKSDVEPIMLVPMGILAIIALLIGIYPQNAILFVLSPVSMFTPVNDVFEALTQITSAISLLIFIFLVILIAVTLILIIFNKKKVFHSTWGCAYNRPNKRMQYSSSSYADLFISTLKPLFKRVEHIRKPKELFPKEAYYEVEMEDIEEAYIVKPLVKFDEEFLQKFERIQNGNMQQYILFGLIFLILAIIGLIYWG